MRCEPGPLCAPVCSGGASGEDCRGGGFGGLSAGFPLSQSSLKSAGLRRAAALRCCFSWGRAWCTRGLWLRLCAQTGGVCSQCRLRGAITRISDTLILIFSVKLQDTQYQQLQQPQGHYLPRVQLLGSHLDCEVLWAPRELIS